MISAELIQQGEQLIAAANHIVIVAHMGPDGDAIGSVLGMYHYLMGRGKTDVTPVLPDNFPRHFLWMPRVQDILLYETAPEAVEEAIAKADLIIIQDLNSLKRMGKVAPLVGNSSVHKLLIDHHLEPDSIADVCISIPSASSASELVFRFIEQNGGYDAISLDAARCIYAGIMTDTGNFQYSSSDPDLYIIVSQLLRKGVDKTAIYQAVFDTQSLNAMRLRGYCISQKMKIFPEQHTALICLSAKELHRFNYQSGDTEGVVNIPLSIDGIFFSVLMREDKEKIKISFRSQGDFPCPEMAAYFNGGGHFNASGGESYLTLEETASRFVKLLPDYYEKHRKS